MKKLIVLFLLGLVSTASAQVYHTDVQYASVTPTVSTSPAYTAKDSVGGLLTFRGICKASNTVQVNSVTITDKADQAVAYDLQLFSANPTASTFTDNSVTAVNTTDLAKILPVISLLSTDHFSYSATGVSSLSSLNSGGFVTTTGGTLYGVLVTRGTPTYTSTSDITVRVGYMCN